MKNETEMSLDLHQCPKCGFAWPDKTEQSVAIYKRGKCIVCIVNDGEEICFTPYEFTKVSLEEISNLCESPPQPERKAREFWIKKGSHKVSHPKHENFYSIISDAPYDDAIHVREVLEENEK